MTKLRSHEPATYRIYVQGILDEQWSDQMGGITITPVDPTSEAPVTILAGRLLDQAALFGVLNLLYDMRLPLLAVECEDWEDEDL